MIKNPRPYFSYLLRLWRSGQDQGADWRASLECPLSGERHGFASLKDLFAFLEAQAQGTTVQDPEASDTPARKGNDRMHRWDL